MENKALFIEFNAITDLHDSNMMLVDNVLPQLRKFSDEGYYLILIADYLHDHSDNFKGDEKAFDSVFNSVSKEIEQYIGAGINSAYTKESRRDYFVSPKPGIPYMFAIQLKLDLKECVLVGKTSKDNRLAKNATIGTYIDIEHFIQYAGI